MFRIAWRWNWKVVKLGSPCKRCQCTVAPRPAWVPYAQRLWSLRSAFLECNLECIRVGLEQKLGAHILRKWTHKIRCPRGRFKLLCSTKWGASFMSTSLDPISFILCIHYASVAVHVLVRPSSPFEASLLNLNPRSHFSDALAEIHASIRLHKNIRLSNHVLRKCGI